MTRARAQQLNIEVKSLLFESRFDISESWILPHAPYVCLISFAGEDGKRNDDRETKGCLLFQTRPVRPPARPVRPASQAPSLSTGQTAGNAGQTGPTPSQVQLAVRPPAIPVGPAQAPLAVRPPSTPVRPADAWAEPNFPKSTPTIKGAPPPNSKGEKK